MPAVKIGFDAALGVHPAALKLRAQRMEVLANNIANADTPNYKARDIDFRTVLAERLNESGAADAPLARTHGRHLGTTGSAPLEESLQYRNPLLPSLDGNTVDGNMEKTAFADNTLQLQASLRFLDGRFKGLMTAIKGE